MKKIELLSIIIVLIAVGMVGIFGCGQQTTATATTPTIGGRIVVIAGSLYGGTIRASALGSSAAGLRVMSVASAPIANYSVMAVGTADNKNYFSATKTATADGSFSIAVPSGESFYLEVIDDKGKFAAPVSFSTTSEGVIMAVTSEAGKTGVDLGQIVFESGKGAAVPTTEPTASKLDKNSTARKKSGESFVPVGAAPPSSPIYGGRGTGEALLSDSSKLVDTVDEDRDGIPDVIDIDAKGDGVVNGLKAHPYLNDKVPVKVTGVNNTNFFSNFTRQYSDYPTFKNSGLNTDPLDVAAITNLAIEAVMPTGTSPNIFSDVRITDGPTWLQTATVSAPSGPSPLWKDQNLTLTRESDRWDIHVIPNGTPEAGDVLRFRVTDTTGATQEFVSTISIKALGANPSPLGEPFRMGRR